MIIAIGVATGICLAPLIASMLEGHEFVIDSMSEDMGYLVLGLTVFTIASAFGVSAGVYIGLKYRQFRMDRV